MQVHSAVCCVCVYVCVYVCACGACEKELGREGNKCILERLIVLPLPPANGSTIALS